MSLTGRALGVDYGRRRVGLAVSDPLRTVATPLKHLPVLSMKEAWKGLLATVQEHQPTAIVVGLPLHMDGRKSELSDEAEQFADGLRKRLPGMEVIMWDERLSSKQANRVLSEGSARIQQKKSAIDSMAAQLILQNWLDSFQPDLDWDLLE